MHILRKPIYETGVSRFYDTVKGPQDKIQVDLVFRRFGATTPTEA